MYTLLIIPLVSFVVVASGEECDSCIDHYRFCVDRGIVDPDQPNVTIDCSEPDHKLRCPKRCGVCTPCDYVNQSEHDVAIQQLQNEDSELELEVKNLEKILNQYINRQVLLTILQYSATSTWDGNHQVRFSVDNNHETTHCFHSKKAPFSEEYALYKIPDSYVDQVKVLLRNQGPKKMEGAYAQVCQKDGGGCQNCTAFEGVFEGGEWVTSDCTKQQGTEIRVRNDDQYIVICEIQIYGTPAFAGVL